MKLLQNTVTKRILINNPPKTVVTKTEILALERHVIIEEFAQIEGFLDLIIFAKYAY